jgi:hypothetical protein
MKASIGRAISSMLAPPGGWVRVDAVGRELGGIVISFGVYAGKRGRRLLSQDIRCRGVLETHICDLDGGGIGLYSSGHPAARQYADQPALLRCVLGDRAAAGLGAMLSAHLRLADDWIPFDRYVRETKDPLVVRGPAFVVRGYATAPRRLGLAPKVSAAGRARRHVLRCRVLHFGNSFVVARGFEAVTSRAGAQGDGSEGQARG